MTAAEPPLGFLDLLKQLVRQPSVVGAEQPFLRYVQRELEEAGARTTAWQGLLVAEGAAPASGYVSAHVDRHGLVCTGPNEFQYAAFVARHRGDLQGDSVSEQTFRTLASRFVGADVQAYEETWGGYLGQGRIGSATYCERRGNLMFTVDELADLRPGTPVAWLDRLRVDSGRIAAQLDNALGAAALVWLFRSGFRGTGFFSTQEEAGRSWRFLLEWFQRFDRATDRLLVLDTSPYPDVDAADAQDVVLRRRDAHAPFAGAMVDELVAACGEVGARFGFKDEYIERTNPQRTAVGKAPRSLGVTELGRLVAAAGGRVTGTTLQVPTTDYHTADESASLRAVARFLDVLLVATRSRGA
ncbi:MAG: peptidase M42 [Planctomycetes bacterium]|nr:peptidase M42 [Planctomycetota bacterium]